jgi:hypothetical protein
MIKYISDLTNYCLWPDSLMRVNLRAEEQEEVLVEVLQREVVEEDLLEAEEVLVDVVSEVVLLAEGVGVEEPADLVEEEVLEVEEVDGGEARHTLKIKAGKLYIFIPFLEQ